MSIDQKTKGLFPTIVEHKTANLITFRKSGEAVATPVWFVITDEKLYVRTQDGTGKIRRIRNNSHVQLAPSTARGKSLGPAVDATARILPDQAKEIKLVERLLNRRYFIETLLLTPLWVFTRLRGRKMVFVEIVPH